MELMKVKFSYENADDRQRYDQQLANCKKLADVGNVAPVKRFDLERMVAVHIPDAAGFALAICEAIRGAIGDNVEIGMSPWFVLVHSVEHIGSVRVAVLEQP